jgi:Fic family protein
MRDYPHLQFRKHWDLSDEVLFELGQCDAMITAIAEMPLRPNHYQELMNVALVKGAQATTAIEGNTLSESEVERIVEGEKLPPSKEYQEIEVRNIIEAMNAILQEVVHEDRAQLIDRDLLLRFHKMVGQNLGEHLDAIPGRLREDQRVVGPYRCPDYKDVPELLDRLCDWMRTEFRYESGNQTFVDAVVQAVVTHVYIEWIHPFGDGNGRTGRLVEFYILLRAGLPNIASHVPSNFYNLTRTEYYRQLALASKTQDLSQFIAYAVCGFRDGLSEILETIQLSQFTIGWRSYIYEKLAEAHSHKDVLKRRRRLALAIPLGEAVTAEEAMTLSANLAREYATLSERTAFRDLVALEEAGLVVRDKNHFSANIAALRMQMPSRRTENHVLSQV